MAISVKYFITDVSGNFIDWDQSVPDLSILGKEAQIAGGAGIDTAFVQAGTSADLTALGPGNDKVYLTGNLADYTQTIDQDTGVYTFTRNAGLPVGQSEVVKVTVSNEDDLLYFANGHITLNAETDSRLYDGSSFQSLQTGWLTAGGTPATGPVERGAPTTASSMTRVFITDAGGVDLPALPQPGQRMVVNGSAGDDSVYVKAGTYVDASNLVGGNDKVYLGGSLADYSQSIDQDTGVYTLTRTTASGVEVVKVTISNEDDVLYFADGHIVINAETNSALFDPMTGAFASLTSASLVSGSTPVDAAGLTTAEVHDLSVEQVAALTAEQLATTTASGKTVLEELTPEQVAALTTAQLDALPPAQIAVLTQAQVAALTSAQVASLDPAQVAALTITQLDAFTAAQVAAITPEAVAALTATQVASLDATQVAALTTAQLDAVTAAQIAAIVPTAVAALTPAQLASLDAAQIGALTAAQVAVLSTTQLDAFTAAQIAALSPAAVAALTVAQVASLDATQVAALTTTQLDAVTAAQIAALVPTAVAALTPAQLASLDTTQIGALTAAQVAVLSTTQLDAFTAAQIAALTPAAVAALSTTQVASLDATQVAALTTAQLDVFTAAKIAALTPAAVAALSTTQVASLDATQVAALTTTQLDAVTASQIAAIVPTAVAALTPAQLASLDTTQIGALTAGQVAVLSTTQLDAFTAAQIAALSPAAVAALSTTQVASLDATQVAALTTTQLDVFTAAKIAAIVPTAVAALTATQLASLDTTQIGALTAAQVVVLSTTQLDAFTAAQIAALSPAAVAALSTTQVASLDATQVAALTTTQLDAVTASQIAAIVPTAVAALTPAQLASLDTTQIGALTAAQVAVLSTTQLDAFTAVQIAALSPAAVAALSTTQVASLDATQVAALTTTQLDVFTAAKIAAIVPTAVAALTATQLASLDTTQIGALTAAQVAVLSTTQLDAFTAVQIAALSPAAVAALSTTQVASLDATQVAALTTTQLDAVTASQIAAIVPTAVAALTPAQLASLDTTQIGALTAAQVAVLSTTQLDAFTAAQIAALSPAAVAALSTTQVASLDATQVAALTTTQLDVFTAAKIAAIVPTAVAALTATQLASLDATQIGALTAAQVAVLSTTQLDVFTAVQIAALTPAAVAALTTAQVASLDATQVTALTTTQLDAVTASQIAAIVPAAVAALTAAQLASLDTTQIGALTAAQAAALTTTQLDGVTAAQIAALTPTAVAALTATQLASLDATQIGALTAAQVAVLSTGQLDAFTAAQIAALAPAAVAALTVAQVASLDATQVAAFTTTQLDAFTASQIAAIVPTAVAALTPAQLASLDTTQVGALTAAQAAALTTTQLDVVTAAQIAALTPAALAALTAAQLASLDTTQIAALTAAQAAALTTTQLDVFTATQIAALTPAAVAALTVAQVASLDATQVAALTTTQLDAVTATQIAAITPAAVAALTVAQVASLDATQVGALTTTQLDAVTATQIAALAPAAVAALTTTQVASLDATQVAALTTTELDVVTATQIAAIVPTAVAALTVAQVASLDATQVAALTTTQLDAVTATQIVAIVPTAVAALTTTQVGSLDATQVGALSTTQLDAVTTTQIAAIAPTALAGMSVAQLTSLDNAQQAALTSAQLAALSPAQLVAVQSNWSVASAGDVSEGAGVITYTVSRTGSTGAATLQFTTAGGSATAGSDYTAVSQTLSFAAGETSKSVTVAVTDDAVAEANETVVAAISNASTGTISTSAATASILDNDQSVWSVASAGDVDEGAGVITYTVSRTGTTGAATIEFATAGGTATAGSDYTAANQTLSFAAGETVKNITVAITNDAVAEGNETVTVAVSNASTGSIANNTATATILDNDQSIWSLASASNVDEGAGFITYTVSRTGATGAATIEFATAGGTATAGSDYTAANQTLSFAAGETSKTVMVAVADDAVAESNETVTAVISSASTGNIATGTVTATILDNDQSVWAVASVGNVDEGAGSITYTVSRTGATDAATIAFSTAGGTATAGDDYTAASQILSFAAGETSKTITVAVINDAVAEGNETVAATISSASTGSIAVNTATATILDNDQSNWSLSSAGNVDEGAGFITYTVSRTGAADAATIEFATAGGTATAGSDYTAASRTLSFAAGETSKTVTVALADDAVAEGNETVTAAISKASTGSIVTNTATATILDNEQSIWSVASAGSVDEGAGFIAYTVSRTGASGSATIQFVTGGGTATPGSDYTAASQTLSFAAGENSKTVMVAVTNDAVAEANETVTAAIKSASSGTIAIGTATATILDNDQSIWSVASAGNVDEGAGFLTYVVGRTGSTAAATIQFATAGGTATAGSDYTAANQVLSFAAGETSKTVTVAVTNDAVAESNETVRAVIKNASGGSIATNTATATILDNDQSIWSVASAGDVDEGAGFLTYTVGRTGSTAAATIQFATAGGTATAGSDYTAVNQTLSFAAGETSKTVTVAVIDDAVAEANQTVAAGISNASTGSIATNTASATIVDNDQSLWSLESSSTVSEGAGSVTYTVSRTGSTGAATIQFAASGGSATAGTDYTPVNQTLSFAAGEMAKTVTVAILDDAVAEVDESLIGILSNPSSGSLATDARLAAVLIMDDDQMNWTVVSAGNVDEGAGSLTYVVSRTGVLDAATIQFTTAGGTATAGVDFTPVNQTLSFAAGETSKTVTVDVIDNAVAQDSRSVWGVISNPSAGDAAFNASQSSAIAYILDNDQSNWSVASAGNVDEGAGFIAYTVSRTGATAAATIQFTTAGGTATAGSDYTATGQTLSFAAGETSKTVMVAVADDAVAEGNETVLAAISNASTGTISAGTATATILDNEQSNWSVIFGINAASVWESTSVITYTVSRTGAMAAATIEFATAGGTATPGSDYIGTSQTLSFGVGEISKVVSVTLTDDAVAEADESLVGTISNASTGSIVVSGVGPLLRDDDQSNWRIGNVNDSDEGAGMVAFVVNRYGAISAAATIVFSTSGGTATAGSDYTASTQTLSFAVGESSKIVTVAIADDAVAESNETVIAAISNASTGNIITYTDAATILDNDQSRWIVGGNVTVDEGAGAIAYTVSRTGATGAATIVFSIAGGTAMAGSDFTATLQTLSFAAGESTKTVMVAVTDDAVAEVSETVQGLLSNASAGYIATSSALATILDNDQSRTVFSIGPTAGTTPVYEDGPQAPFTIIRSGDVSGSQTIQYYVSGGTASAGSDYTAIGTATVTFAPGETSKVVKVGLLGDAVVEGDETLIVSLFNASAGSISTGSATATLTDNETITANSFSLVASGANVYESEHVATFAISRVGSTMGTATTYFRINGGTALADSDYTDLPAQTLSWAVGESVKTVFVNLIDDASAESTETIIGQSATDSGFTTGTATATMNILDNDTAATGTNTYAIVTIASGVAYESAGVVDFSITRSGDLTTASTSYFRTNGGTATAGTDYTAVAGQTLNWSAGETQKLISVAMTNDSAAEGNETIIGQSAIDSGFTTGAASATTTVLDDDAFTTTAGVADILTTGTVSGSYLGGSILNTGDMNDTVTIGVASTNNSVIDLGAGNDTLNTGTVQTRFFVNGAQYIGGTGVDTLALNTTTAFNFSTTASAGNFVKGFEIVSMAAAGNQTLNLGLADVLEFTSGNAVTNTLRITGTSGDILNLQALGKTLGTPSAGTGNLTDVDGATYDVVASVAGNAAANDVTIGGTVYDVYQYQHNAQTVTMLINTALTTNVI